MALERYEFSDEKSDKFWEVEVCGTTLTVCYGRIGSAGQSKDKDFSTAEAAEKEKAKLIKEKTGKGYVLTSAAPIPPAKETAATPALAEEDEDEADILAWQDEGLPTRCYPAQAFLPLSPEEDWSAFRECMLESWAELTLDEDADRNAQIRYKLHAKTVAELPERIPDSPDLEIAARWLQALDYVLCPDFRYWEIPEGTDYYNFTGQALTRALLARIDLLALLQFLQEHEQCMPCYSPAWMCLRAWISILPEAEYAKLLEQCLAWEAACRATDEETQNADISDLACILAWVLADDRLDSTHPLRAQPILNRIANYSWSEDGPELACLLLIDTAATQETLFKEHSTFWLLEHLSNTAWTPHRSLCGLYAIVKTAVRQGLHYGAVPYRTLNWLCHPQLEADLRQAWVEGIFAANRPEIVEVFCKPLSSYSAEVVQAALAHPDLFFSPWLTRLARNDLNPRDHAIWQRMIAAHTPAQLRAWTRHCSDAERALLEAYIQEDQQFAARADWPGILQTPRWPKPKSKGKSGKAPTLKLEALEATCKIHIDPKQTSYWDESYHGRCKLTQLSQWKERWENWGIAPEHDSPMPADSASAQDKTRWIVQRIQTVNTVKPDGTHYAPHPLYDMLCSLNKLPAYMALALWNTQGSHHQFEGMNASLCAQFMLRHHGAQAFPGLLALLERDLPSGLSVAQEVDSPQISPFVAKAFLQRKPLRKLAAQWFARYPQSAALGLIEPALCGSGVSQEAACEGLRYLVRQRLLNKEEVLDIANDTWGQHHKELAATLHAILDEDPLDLVPAKLPALPLWFVPRALSRLVLCSTGLPLPDEAVQRVAEMLSFTPIDLPYAGLAELREACTPASLAAFAWDVFSLWLAEGANPKENWAMLALGHLGDDETVRRISPLIRAWPGESANARAVAGLDVLNLLGQGGSDLALMHLNGIAEKVKFPALRVAANAKIEALAQARGLSRVELSDRLVPDFDLDAQGGLDLDFGPRQFRVGFDEQLRPWIRDAEGNHLADLPKPRQTDDAALAKAAKDCWGALKKDVRAVASLQLHRLETMLVTGRRITPRLFTQLFTTHPLIRHLARRLVWGVYADTHLDTRPHLLFRVDESAACCDVEDKPVELAASEDQYIGILHPLETDAQTLAAWGQIFGDYEIIQPFPQLGRQAYHLSADGQELQRQAGKVIASGRLRGIANIGTRSWQIGPPQDGGCIYWAETILPLPREGTASVTLAFGNGLYPGGAEEATQTLGALTISGTGRFDQLGAVQLSELIRDMELLTAAEN